MGRGRLMFKGDGEKKARKKKKKSKHSVVGDGIAAATADAAGTTRSEEVKTATGTASHTVEALSKADAPKTPMIRKGTGHITTSGTVVTGFDTRFEKELSVGDALLVQLPTGQEMRVITMRLSNTSLNLSSAFTQSLTQPVAFEYIAKPKATSTTVVKHNSSGTAGLVGNSTTTTTTAQANTDGSKPASGIYDSTSTGELVYREKTEHGSYRIKRVQVQGDVSRTDLLQMRAKKKSDKYC